MKKISRRTFIKGAALAGTAFAASPMIFVPKARASYAKGSLIHPNVNNLRVVGITDPSMTRGEEVGID
ncbi:MAG: twin-arginine translocation signal domain-containing protein [Deltaproteobacteria bacterium]